MIEHGVNPYRIDRVLEDFGMAMGVSKMMDLSGVDIFSHVDDQMKGQYPYCYDGTLLKEMVSSGRLGQKKGRGMYRYKDRNTFQDEQAVQVMDASQQRAEKSVEDTDLANKALDQIAAGVENIRSMNSMIAKAAEDQNQVVSRIRQNIGAIAEVSDRTLSGSSRTLEQSDDINRVVKRLGAIVGRFRV